MLSLLLGCPGSGGLPWGSEPEDTGPERDGWFHPREWAFEAWAYYDGETLDGFRYYENSSGSLPPYVAVYLLGTSLMCTWIGAVQVEGLVTLDEEQWAAYAVSLSMTETDCDNLDPSEWGAVDPTPVLDGLLLGLGWKDLTDEVDDAIKEVVGRSGWTYEKEYEDMAFTQVLGLFDEETGTWTAHDVGPAFTYVTSEDRVLDTQIGELRKMDRGDDLELGVVSGYTLAARPLSEITPF